MKCPTCSHQLTEMTVREIKVDVCKGGCGGIWFDYKELKKVDEQNEDAGDLLMEIERKSPQDAVDCEARRPCPCCEGVTMMRHFCSAKRQIEVDECPNCGGFWLDVGELASLRDEFPTEATRREAAEQIFAEAFAPEQAAQQTRKTARKLMAFTGAPFLGYGYRRL